MYSYMIRAPMAPGEKKPTKKEEKKKIAEENRARKAAMLDPSKTKQGGVDRSGKRIRLKKPFAS